MGSLEDSVFPFDMWQGFLLCTMICLTHTGTLCAQPRAHGNFDVENKKCVAYLVFVKRCFSQPVIQGKFICLSRVWGADISCPQTVLVKLIRQVMILFNRRTPHLTLKINKRGVVLTEAQTITSAGSDVILLVRIFNRSASLLTTFVRNHQNHVWGTFPTFVTRSDNIRVTEVADIKIT